MLPDYAALAEAVRVWAARNSVPVDQVELRHEGRPEVILRLADGPGDPEEAPAERGAPLSPITLDILTVLSAAGKPLTTTRILEAMARHKPPMEWSSRSVNDHLARMVKDGTLTSGAGGKPGYAVAE